jgi:hypothetical protein
LVVLVQNFVFFSYINIYLPQQGLPLLYFLSPAVFPQKYIKELLGCPSFATSVFDSIPKTGLLKPNQIITYHSWQKYKAAPTSLPIGYSYSTEYCYFLLHICSERLLGQIYIVLQLNSGLTWRTLYYEIWFLVIELFSNQIV